MPMVTVAEIETRINRDVASSAQTQLFIDDVSALVQAYVGPKSATWITPAATPPAIKAIVALEVIRHLNVEPGIKNEKVDVLATAYAYEGAVVALSEGAQEAIDFFLFGGGRRSKLASIGTQRLAIDRHAGPEVDLKDEYDVWQLIPGDSETITFKYSAPEGESPLNLTGFNGTLSFNRGGESVLTKTVAVDVTDNTFTIDLTKEETTELGKKYPSEYTFRIASADLSIIKTLVIGAVLFLEP